ncbi:MAG: hypothetical protein RL001_2641 [Pseudomonadota bacterium]|jgi:hypothetical protein
MHQIAYQFNERGRQARERFVCLELDNVEIHIKNLAPQSA